MAAGVGLFPRINTSGTRAAVLVLGVPVDCSGAGVLFSSCGGFAACLVFIPIIWKNSSRAAAGVRFLLKKRKCVKIIIKSVDTDTKTWHTIIKNTGAC